MADKDVWIGGATGDYNDASNWWDRTTGSVATTAPGAGDTAIFTRGTYDITGPTPGVYVGGGADVIIQPGADVTLSGPTPNPGHGSQLYDFGSITEMPNSSVTLDDAALNAENLSLKPGATFTQAPGTVIDQLTEWITLGALHNNHGRFFENGPAELNLVLNQPPPTGPFFVQNGGVTPQESAFPVTSDLWGNQLRIDLGNLPKDSSEVMQILPFNMTGGTFDMSGSGFSITTWDPSSGFPAGAPNIVTADTSTPGHHTEIVTFTSSGGSVAASLVITDHIV
jgi:hypothetical protein